MRKTRARYEWGVGQMKKHVSFKAGLASHDVGNNDTALKDDEPPGTANLLRVVIEVPNA